jgi:hypothetical protein
MPRLAALAETVASVAVAAWVGGHAALGAYAARILFRDLPRDTAATTMTTVFRSFDLLLAICVATLAVATLVRVFALGIFSRGGVARRSDVFGTLLAAAMVAVGLAALLWVHPAIERMFHEGATMSSRFAAFHRLSEQIGHAEVVLGILLFGSFAWGRTRV